MASSPTAESQTTRPVLRPPVPQSIKRSFGTRSLSKVLCDLHKNRGCILSRLPADLRKELERYLGSVWLDRSRGFIAALEAEIRDTNISNVRIVSRRLLILAEWTATGTRVFSLSGDSRVEPLILDPISDSNTTVVRVHVAGDAVVEAVYSDYYRLTRARGCIISADGRKTYSELDYSSSSAEPIQHAHSVLQVSSRCLVMVLMVHSLGDRYYAASKYEIKAYTGRTLAEPVATLVAFEKRVMLGPQFTVHADSDSLVAYNSAEAIVVRALQGEVAHHAVAAEGRVIEQALLLESDLLALVLVQQEQAPHHFSVDIVHLGRISPVVRIEARIDPPIFQAPVRWAHDSVLGGGCFMGMAVIAFVSNTYQRFNVLFFRPESGETVCLHQYAERQFHSFCFAGEAALVYTSDTVLAFDMRTGAEVNTREFNGTSTLLSVGEDYVCLTRWTPARSCLQLLSACASGEGRTYVKGF